MEFRVTPQLILDGAASCDNTAAEIKVQLDVLKSYVTNLEAIYHGVTADTFNDLMLAYDTASNQLQHALLEIGVGLRGNAANYTETENKNTTNLVQIHGSLPGARL